MSLAPGAVQDAANPASDPVVGRDFSELPWWRRPRRLSRQLVRALMVTALLAVMTFGGLNYIAARDLLVRGTQERLVAIGATRAVSIEAGTERLLSEVSVASSDVFIADALAKFTKAFAELNEKRLSAAQRAQLRAGYEQRVVEPLQQAGLTPPPARELVPRTRAGRWLQYHYTLRPPGTEAPADAGDGTRYSALNAELTSVMRAFSESVAGDDVLLIDRDGTIVYSVDKGNDVGTNLVSGPYADSAFAQIVTDRLPITRVGTTLLTDFAVSPTGEAALYAVSAVPGENSVIGALAVEIPVSALNRLTTGATGGESLALTEADTYIVASDTRLQSEPRSWIEDPAAYLQQLRDSGEVDQVQANVIELIGSPVGVQLIDTPPVQSAIDGENFQGSAPDAFGDATFAAAEPFTAGDRPWVVVTQIPRSAALAPLGAYVMRLLAVLAIVLPVVAAFGIWLARALTRPIRPTVEAAAAIVAGDRQPDVDTSRSDEFGDLARRLTAMAGALGAHERHLADEYERTRQLLLAVLPPKLVDDDGSIVGTGEGAAQATVVAVMLAPVDSKQDPGQAGDALRRIAQLAERIAVETGLERVRMAADRFLFLAGMDLDDPGADAAIQFAAELRSGLLADGEDLFALHVGLSTGAVATGLLDSGALTFGAWGEPVRQALALASLAHVDVVLIDRSTVQASTMPSTAFEAAHDVVDLDDRRMDLYRLTHDGR